MSKFRDELRVVPGVVRGIAWALGLGLFIVIGYFTSYPPDGHPMPLVARILLPPLSFAVVFVYLHLIGYVYGDAKRRGMRYVMWTLLAIFIPNAIGIILYFILRDPLPVTCGSCHTSVLSKFTFCPSCGAPMRPTCPQCGKAVEMGWSHCADCGAALPGQTRRTGR